VIIKRQKIKNKKVKGKRWKAKKKNPERVEYDNHGRNP
jgi:hypothetical protein